MRPASPIELTWRFVRRLRDKLNLTESTCFATDDVMSVNYASLGDAFYIVTDEGSTFNSQMDQNPLLLWETRFINVTACNRLYSNDESGIANSLVRKDSKNVYEMQRRVLKCLVGWRLGVDGEQDLEICSTVKASRSGRPTIIQAGENGFFIEQLATTFLFEVSLNTCERWGDWDNG